MEIEDDRAKIAMKAVSVIVPTYNCAGLIGNAIESVLNQAYKNVEIIVADDGSTDGTEEVLKNYTKAGVVTYLRQENKGPAAARNLAIKRSRGEFVCFLDADDTLEANSIQDRLHAFAKHPELGLVFTDYRKVIRRDGKDTICEESVLSEGKFIDRIEKGHIKLIDGNVCLFNKEIWYELAVHCFIWTGTVMVRRDVFNEVGYFEEGLRIAEDHDLWLRICRSREVGFFTTRTATYVMHDASVTKNEPLYCDSAIKVYSRSLDPLYGLPERYRKRLVKQIALHFFHKGYYYWEQKTYALARREFRQAMCRDPWHYGYTLYWFTTFLPHRAIGGAKILKGRLRALTNKHEAFS